jgi:ketosteroid isomerase-like protein
MKKFLYFFLVCALVAQVTKAQSKDEKQVAVAVEALRKAMLDADQKQLESLAADDLSYGHSAGLIEDKAAFVNALVSGKSDFATINLSDQTIKIRKDVAVVRHNLTGELVSNGTPSPVKLGVLLVWQKQSGTWKLLARQAFKLP